MKKLLVVAVTALSVLGVASPALAEPVNQFSFQITGLKPDGRFTLIFQARTFDTTGAVPPELLSNYLRVPAGATLRKEFLNKRFYCNGRQLRDAIDNHLEGSGTPFADRVADLPGFIKTLRKSKTKRDKRDLANALICQRATIGTGTAQIDARATIPALDQLVPSKFTLFFSKPTVPGAVAGFTVVGAADVASDAPIVKKYPIVGAVHVALTANFFNDPTPDGLYGYKLVLPDSNVNGLKVSIAELRVVNTGLTLKKGECLKTGKGGRCVKKQKKTLFWFNTPPCPASGKLSFLSFFEYVAPQPPITQTVELACPKFLP